MSAQSDFLPKLRRAPQAKWLLASLAAVGLSGLLADELFAQSFGVESHNNLMPASGGMGGVSIARPQDLLSGINANPATLSQFRGTQMVFGSAWAEPTYNISHTGGALPGVGTYSAKSEAQGIAGGNIGITQDLSELGVPGTWGLGFITNAAGGADFRQAPASNGTNSALTVLEFTSGLGLDITDRLSVGASVSLGSGFFDGPFVGISGLSYDYALRGAVGMDYDIGDSTTLGMYYQSKQGFRFDNAILLDLGGGAFSDGLDINMDLPNNYGFGIANTSLCEGRLLLGADVVYKQWDDTALFGNLYDNQWVLQLGTQYTLGKYRLRGGYVFAENPLSPNPGNSAGGVTPPGLVNAIQYGQAQMAIINQNRATIGVGVVDVLPGIDFDLFGGGMFRESDQLGPLTSVTVESYWLGAGLTWYFGRGSCERLPAPDSWTNR